ncbi:hypothetical protein [Saccharomonospora sp.]|uniref:hypothetical protein n=1 Tax=Saccharomonospora sp. TaxID=33913 RepID=UPI00260B0256|nr:hypothetical protein [Saccharomonospora sp.]
MLNRTGIPQPWDINEWLNCLERARGRDIDLCALTWEPGDATGAWQPRGDHDVIAYPANTSGYHQNHIILHEVGHMLFQHPSRCVLSRKEARRIAPNLSANAFTHLFGRAHGTVEEYEAEQFAHILHARVTTRSVPRSRNYRSPQDDTTASLAARLADTFDEP